MDDGTIKKIFVSELEFLVSLGKCTVAIIESDDRKSLQFKLIYKNTESQMCGPPKVLEEQVMLQFKIEPKKVKQQV